MKKLFFLPAVIGLVISSCQEPASETEPPVLEITTSKNIEVPLEGGDFSFSYKLENKTPEGVISAGTKADWITGVNYGTEGSVTFNVSPNRSSEQRTGYVAITYTYDGGTLSDSVAAVQSASEPVEYDYELDAAIFTGYYYGNAFGNDGEHNYWITFSDTEMIDLEMQPGGIYYSFDIFAPAPENADNPSLPMGTYTVGKYNSAEPGQFLTGYVDYDNYIYGTCFLGYDDYTELTRYAMAINGEIEITNKGNNEYDISFSLLDKHEYTFDGSWSGTLPVQDISEAPAPQNARRIDYMTK